LFVGGLSAFRLLQALDLTSVAMMWGLPMAFEAWWVAQLPASAASWCERLSCRPKKIHQVMKCFRTLTMYLYMIYGLNT